MGKHIGNQTVLRILAVTVFSCVVMAIVDGVIQPGYAVKSAIKLVMFLLLPILVAMCDREIDLKSLFKLRKSGMVIALFLGLGIYALVVGGYFLLSQIIDFSGIVGSLSENVGVQKNNFVFVALYISFINSLLEEFFFRGFVFLNIKKHCGRSFAYGISAFSFSLYHVAMMIGWFELWVFGLVLIGLMIGGIIFNYLDEKQGTIYTSWLTHMFANFAINTVGFILMG